jgi:hypothetical protein
MQFSKKAAGRTRSSELPDHGGAKRLLPFDHPMTLQAPVSPWRGSILLHGCTAIAKPNHWSNTVRASLKSDNWPMAFRLVANPTTGPTRQGGKHRKTAPRLSGPHFSISFVWAAKATFKKTIA